jgi:hypothetical protein
MANLEGGIGSACEEGGSVSNMATAKTGSSVL